MTSLRLWHPSRDAHHCAFRLIRILLAGKRPLEIERARIFDMLVLYPSLLHNVSMPSTTKAAFRALNIPKPNTLFIRLPSTASVFQDLTLFQNSAIAHLTGRGIAKLVKEERRICLDRDVPMALRKAATDKNASDLGLTEFLWLELAKMPLRGADSIYSRFGLPTRVIAE